MKKHYLKIFLLATLILFAGCDKKEQAAQPIQSQEAEKATAAKSQQKPALKREAMQTIFATVTAIDQETRKVTLQDTDGESFTFVAGDQVRNLAQVEVGDKLKVDYLQSMEIKVLAPDEAEVGVQHVVSGQRAEPGEKPAGAAITKTSIISVIEAINKEKQTVTLKGPENKTRSLRIRDPANLEKLAIGDKVMITYAEAVAVKVTEK